MAQSEGGAETSGEASDARKEGHRGIEAESAPDILRRMHEDHWNQLHANNGQTPEKMVPRLFGEIRERYLERPGGYTRVLRIEPIKEDQAESAILELVDGPKDMRFAMTAKTLARLPKHQSMNEITAKNVQKVTRYRKDGVQALREMVDQMREHHIRDDDSDLPDKRKVYPEEQRKREMHYR